MKNKKIYVTRTGGIIVNQAAPEKVYVDTLTCTNIMKPGDRYLVFCEESELSQLLDSKIPQFRCIIAKFGILNIDRDDEYAVTDYTTFSDKKFFKYNMLINQEFLTTSNNTLSEFIKFKHEIFSKYNIE